MAVPHPDQIRDAWSRVLLPSAPSGNAAERFRWLTLLEGLPLIAAGQIPDETNAPLTLSRLLAHALAQEQAATWQVDSPGAGRPFLCELARRSLALGHLSSAHPDEDPVLHPLHSRVDPACADVPLATARAVTAIELHHARLLALVIARQLRWRLAEIDAGRPAPLRPWLAPFLADLVAQCLLVRAFLGCKTNTEHEETQWFMRRLVALYEEERAAGNFAWPPGPLVACCALGLLFRQPREVALITELKDRVQGWPGWGDANLWPIPLPGGGFTDLTRRLTEAMVAAVGAADRWLWRRPALERLLEGCWPPLLSFCVPG